ncbi:hypothetical protein ACH4F6_00505 [Streptomyces sp. NPDC017936]|uniref:hypothetical protein n=1 Tax=Streptomyces sp. NPDC017936 TaxID=3365016 RepID=UPI003793ABB1
MPATPAQATAAECTNGANGFTGIPYDKNGSTVHSVDIGSGVTVKLQQGYINGSNHGWARIDGSTWAGDRVWMDWTWDNGAHWIQCGPFTVQSNGSPSTSAAKVTSPSTSYRFRACGRLLGESSVSCCTPWW